MVRTVLLLAAALTGLAAPAGATQDPAPLLPMSAAEVRATFFGVDMGGVTWGDGEPWRECIEPEGDTVYYFVGETRLGRAWVEDDARLCFTYPESDGDTPPACFQAFRRGDGFVFYSRFNGVFIAEFVNPGVKTCPREIPIG